VDEGWRRKTKREIKELYRHSSIVQYKKVQRIRWLGHVSRMPEQRHVKRVLLEGEGEKKKRGRPKKKEMTGGENAGRNRLEENFTR
jgi:MoaA/NifB/PqqE/SkfB family radical SAM enzyme